MAGLQQYQQQPMDFIDPNDPSLDDSNQDLMVRLFKQERNMRSLLLLLTAFLTSAHSTEMPSFAVIHEALTRIEDIPRRNDRELADAFAYIIDLIEETDDPWQAQPEVVPYEFVALARRQATIHLPPNHNHTIKLWMMSLFLSDDIYSEMEQFVSCGFEKSTLTSFFAGGNAPMHDTGSFIDDNILEDPIRNFRYKYIQDYLLFHLFHERGQENWSSIMNSIKELRLARLNALFVERRPGEEGYREVNILLARFLVLASTIKVNATDKASNESALYYLGQATSTLLSISQSLFGNFATILQTFFENPMLAKEDINTSIAPLAQTLTGQYMDYIALHVRICAFAELSRKTKSSVDLLDSLCAFLQSVWLWNSRKHRDDLLLQVLEDRLKFVEGERDGVSLEERVRFIREVRKNELQEIAKTKCFEYFDTLISQPVGKGNSVDFRMTSCELENWKNHRIFMGHLHGYYSLKASWELSHNIYSSFVISMLRYMLALSNYHSKKEKFTVKFKNIDMYKEKIEGIAKYIQDKKCPEGPGLLEYFFRSNGGILEDIINFDQILLQLEQETVHESPPSLKRQALQTFLRDEERVLHEVNQMMEVPSVREAVAQLDFSNCSQLSK